MRWKMAAVLLLLSALLVLAGCTPISELLGLGGEEQKAETLVNGTTTGNILNGGFAVKDKDELLFYYTGDGVYKKGSLVRSNPETGENSMLMDEAGLYMNLDGGALYYCRADGIYKADLSELKPHRIREGEYSLLQISSGRMYFISGGHIGCAALDGSDAEFAPVENAACLNVYKGTLYYINTVDAQIWRADPDGSNQSVLYDKAVKMFYIIDDVIYFIDAADGKLKRMALEIDPETLETLTDGPCSGFNVNREGLYYTLMEDGLCYNAGADGLQAQAIGDFGTSAWHRACMFGGGALVVRQEDLPPS